ERIKMPKTHVVHLGNNKGLMDVAEDIVAKDKDFKICHLLDVTREGKLIRDVLEREETHISKKDYSFWRAVVGI
ncbi:hypothetical protein Tco_0321591, partial [Tanacetum coccineum]